MRGAVNVDHHGVAGAQHVVLRRGNVHVRLEAQVLVVEQVVAENLVLVAALALQDVVEHGDGVDGQQVAQLLLHLKVIGAADRGRAAGVLGVAQAVAGLVLVGVDAAPLAVVLAHAVLGVGHGLVGYLSEAALADLALVFALDALNLLNVDTALYELGDDFRLRTAFLPLAENERD